MKRSLFSLLAFSLSIAPAMAQDTLVPTGSTWRYLDEGSDPGAAWRDLAFDDAAWAAGPAELGYGDTQTTLIGYGPDANAKYITTWFRHGFMVADPGQYAELTLRLQRDDGAVVHLNGVEVARSNMPAGAITAATTASSAVGGADETTFFSFIVAPDVLIAGQNMLAVEIHQANPTSSDVSFDLELLGSNTVTTVVRGPYLQQGTHDSVVVRWRTATPTDSRVWFGAAPGALDSTVSDAAVTTEHAVTVTGLAPDTAYYYAIGNAAEVFAGDDADHRFVTAPTPGQATATRIWVLGDSGTANANARAVRDAYTAFAGGTDTDLWLMLGDNAYNDGTDAQYQAAVFDTYPAMLRSSVVWPTLGNHDGYTADSATQSGPYYDIFTLPTQGEAGGEPSGTEAYYSFDHGNLHFIVLDSYETDRAPGSPMLTWLADDLAGTTADWIIAFWHHPPYTKGSHDSDVEGRLIEMRENVLPILDSHGVDLVLGGHSHSYERSVLLDGHYGASATLDASMILDGGDGRVGGDGAYSKPTLGAGAHEGAVYCVAGSSGKITNAPLDHPAMHVSLVQLGSMVIDVDGAQLDGRFLNSAGQVTDTFTITKGAASFCGDGAVDPGEACDGPDLGGATCADVGCGAGTPSCDPSCAVDYSTCAACTPCDGDGVCDPGEDCDGCPSDCARSDGAVCGNGVCEAAEGEDCLNCAVDCAGKQSGKRSKRYCCGAGGGENPVGCRDPRCTDSTQCTDAPAEAACCGDGVCGGPEDGTFCAVDCGAPPACGDGVCDPGEGVCACAADCGAPPANEVACGNGDDDDCDGQVDCADADCGGDPGCACAGPGAACSSGADCCSNKCKGPAGGKTCR